MQFNSAFCSDELSWPYNLLLINIFSRYFVESKQVALTLISFCRILFCVQKIARLYQPFVMLLYLFLACSISSQVLALVS